MRLRQRNISLPQRREVNTSFNEGPWQRALINKELNTFLRGLVKGEWERKYTQTGAHTHTHKHSYTKPCNNGKEIFAAKSCWGTRNPQTKPSPHILIRGDWRGTHCSREVSLFGKISLYFHHSCANWAAIIKWPITAVLSYQETCC